jgi:hypothetical protein
VDRADPDRVVAAGDEALELASDPGERAVEHGDAVVDRVGDLGELRLVLGREAPREVLLAGGEHVDAEAPGAPDLGQRARAVVEADEHEHGVERERGDRVRGHPLRATWRVDGHDCHPGGEMPHDGAEALGLDGPHLTTSVPYMPSSSWFESAQKKR